MTPVLIPARAWVRVMGKMKRPEYSGEACLTDWKYSGK